MQLRKIIITSTNFYRGTEDCLVKLYRLIFFLLSSNISVSRGQSRLDSSPRRTCVNLNDQQIQRNLLTPLVPSISWPK